jgi:outer membrane protein assembly factor BamB
MHTYIHTHALTWVGECAPAFVTASYRRAAGGYYLRAWHGDTGRLLWELAAPGRAPPRTLAAAAATQSAAQTAPLLVRTRTLNRSPHAHAHAVLTGERGDAQVVSGAQAGAGDDGAVAVAVLGDTVVAVPLATGRARWRTEPFAATDLTEYATPSHLHLIAAPGMERERERERERGSGGAAD